MGRGKQKCKKRERERKERNVCFAAADGKPPTGNKRVDEKSRARKGREGGREVGTRRIINFRQFCDAVKLAITHKKI
jgi:hypothetical protein